MKNKFELKNVKTWNGHEGTGISCNVYVDGKRAFEYVDGATGGESDIYQVFDSTLKTIVDAHIKAQPDCVSEFSQDDGKPFTFPYNVDIFIDDLMKAHEKVKFARSLKKRMLDSIVIMKRQNDTEFHYYKLHSLIAQADPTQLKAFVAKIRKQLKHDEYIVNTFNF